MAIGNVATDSSVSRSMRASFRLGKIAGIPIGVHWSLVVIAALLTTSLAGSMLPAVLPNANGSYWVAAVLAAALFFASILAQGLDGLTPEQALAVPDDYPFMIGLTNAVSPLRLNGMTGILLRAKRQIREQVAAG